jgi:hypothetical protein
MAKILKQNMANTLALAQHPLPEKYWEGGNYELNMSFDNLRERQWQSLMQKIWDHPLITGPLALRYAPNNEPLALNAIDTGTLNAVTTIQAPPPTVTQNQHGRLGINNFSVGCDIQATRSLFECVTIAVPLGMFAGVVGGPYVRYMHSELQALDEVFYEIALSVYDAVPFQIAAIGYERSCQLLSELRSDSEARHNFLVAGNFLAQETILNAIEPDLSPYQVVRPALRWMPSKVQ